MPPLVVPQAALVRLIWTQGGTQYAVNVLGARKTGAAIIDQAAANAIGAAVKGALTSSGALPIISNTVALATVGVRDISSPNNVEFTDSGAAVPGTAAGALMPPQVAYCVTLRTARAGKSFRGRFYFPGWAVTANAANGTAIASVQTNGVAFITNVRTALPAQGLTLAVVSRKNASTEVVTTEQGRDLLWDTIRGRSRPGI